MKTNLATQSYPFDNSAFSRDTMSAAATRRSPKVVVAFSIEEVLAKIDTKLDEISKGMALKAERTEVDLIKQQIVELSRKGSDVAQRSLKEASDLEKELHSDIERQEKRISELERKLDVIKANQSTTEAVANNERRISTAEKMTKSTRIGLWVAAVIGILQTLALWAVFFKR